MTDVSVNGFRWDYMYIGTAPKRVRLRVTSQVTGYALAMWCDNSPGFGDWLSRMAKLEEALEDWDATGVCPLEEHARLAVEVKP